MPELTKQQQKEVKEEVSKQVEKEVNKRLNKQLFERSKLIGSEFKRQTSTALIAALGFIIALSWQTLLRKFVEDLPKTDYLLKHPYLADFYTAAIVTLLGIIAIMFISRWAKKPVEAVR